MIARCTCGFSRSHLHKLGVTSGAFRDSIHRDAAIPTQYWRSRGPLAPFDLVGVCADLVEIFSNTLLRVAQIMRHVRQCLWAVDADSRPKMRADLLSQVAFARAAICGGRCNQIAREGIWNEGV